MLVAREAVARYYSDWGTSISPQHIVLTVSTSEAYSYCFRLLCEPGDEVLVALPSYPLFEFLADLQDVRLVPFELVYDHGWLIDFHSLVAKITGRTRAILLVNPNNPTGSFVKSGELAELNRLCLEHGLALVCDEVFLDYPQEGKPLSLAGNPGALTFTLSGLSKIAGLPQMKLAWIVTSGPPQLLDEALARLDVIADTYLSPNAPIQWAAPTLLQSRHGIQSQLMQRVRANLAELDRQLSQQKLCSRLQLEGGWYATLRVPVTRSDEELVIALLQQASVLVQPGHYFDFAADGHLVLSLITPTDEFATGVQRLLAFLHAAWASQT
jgi:aspartate/methionine/tyrosine aminotransferase